MKRSLKRILPVLLALVVLGTTVWYLFVYDREFTRDLFLSQARFWEGNGNHQLASWFYEQAYRQSEENENVAIELAQQFKSDGNYTKAEATLSKAIADHPTISLYVALSKIYVEQNKLLDAVNLLDNIPDSPLKTELEALRPQVPTASPNPGFYSQYITVEITADSGTLYTSMDGTFPSIPEDLYQQGYSLILGENTLYALAVGDNGLVSRLGVLGYTVGGVVEPVTLTDSALEAHLRQLLGKTQDDILLTSDLWSLTELTLPAEVSTLADLRYLTGLTKLTVNGNAIDSLQSLSSMDKLTELTITGTKISAEDLSIIAKLPNLQSLTLRKCQLANITPLAAATGLLKLDLGENTIRDITPLASLAALEELDMSQNAVTDVTALGELTALKLLDLSSNSLYSLEPLVGCTGLSQLNVSRNALEALTGLESCTKLTVLQAAYNSVADLTPLMGLNQLAELDLESNQLTDAAALSGLAKLQSLNLAYNQLTALPGFASDCALVYINGSYNQITGLEPLERLPMLNRVVMDYNQISSLEPLVDCPKLIQVDVFGNPVSEVTALTQQGIIVNYTPDL